ncbi:ATP-dependent DNA helicase Hrp3 [Dimargaris cristalligena]|nr:ATP-dependent DNA helicase Hrp3 [Dimargaris cristalligena]
MDPNAPPTASSPTVGSTSSLASIRKPDFGAQRPKTALLSDSTLSSVDDPIHDMSPQPDESQGSPRPTVGNKVPRKFSGQAKKYISDSDSDSQSDRRAPPGRSRQIESNDETDESNDYFDNLDSRPVSPDTGSDFEETHRPTPKATSRNRPKAKAIQDSDDDFSDASLVSEFNESNSSEGVDNMSETSDSDFEYGSKQSKRGKRNISTKKGLSAGSKGRTSDKQTNLSFLFAPRGRNGAKGPSRRGISTSDEESAGQSDDDQSDTSDWGGPRKSRSRKVKSSEPDSVRFSSRRGTNAVKTYNETEQYDWESGSNGETENSSTKRAGTPADPGDLETPALGRSVSQSSFKATPLIGEPDLTSEDLVEALHDYRPLPSSAAEGSVDDDSDPDAEFDPNNFQYLVKWQNWAHLYDTWESYEYLSNSKGFKKLSNYIKNVVEPDFYAARNPDISPEELEQNSIQKELDRQNMSQFVVLDRVIACREAKGTLAQWREMLPGSRTSGSLAFPPKNDEADSATHDADEPGTMEYLCKWENMSYKDATWEPESQIIAIDSQAAIDEFYDRLERQTLPHRGEHYHSKQKARPRFHQLSKQPDYLSGGQLRDYQLMAINWMGSLWSRNENGILADEMGLGKTIQTISFISYLFHTQSVFGPHLVVVPLSTIMAWEREFRKWAPDMNVLCYIGDNRSRQAIRQFEFYVPPKDASGRPIYPDSRWAPPAAQELATIRQNQPKILFNVVLTTYELVLKDHDFLGSIRWAFMAVDEAHRLKNSQSLLSETLRSFHITNCLLVTGTPLQNSVKELYALCNFLMPDKFTDKEHAYFDFQVADADPDKIRDLHQRLRPYMLRRLKKEVEKSLPQKIERILRVELAPLQMHYYRNILARNYQVLNKGASGGSQMSLLNIVMELKKASNHPFLFPNAEADVGGSPQEQLKGLVRNSGKMVLLDKLLTRLKAGGHRVLIFSQMVRLLDILSDYLSLRNYAHQRLDGSVGSEARKKAIDQFNAPQSHDFVFLLSTRAGGLGINLTAADTVIIFDSDWNPQNDLQAMARAHRIGQTKTVSVYRFISKDTIEEDVIERAKRKMVLEYCIIKRMDTSGQSVLQSGSGRISLAAQAALKDMVGDKADALAQLLPTNKANSNQYFNKDELSAILKFGASNMFKESDNQKKLDDLDLDDILDRAEHHDTGATPEDGALGLQGDDFLNQFQVADYHVGDDEDGMADWDDIIPEDERRKVDEEAERERLQREEELYWSSRRRRRVVSYAEDGRDGGEAEGGGSASKGRGRAAARSGAAGSNNGPSGGDPHSLSEKELRSLYKALLKFGNIRTRFDAIVAESELADKERDLLESTYDELIAACEASSSQSKAKRPSAKGRARGGGSDDEGEGADLGDDDGDQDDEDHDAAGSTKKASASNRSATSITFRGVTNIQAPQLLQRIAELECLATQIGPLSNPTRFRLSVSLKPVHNWACSWGQKDDAMLLVGVYLYGFGNWEKIREDSQLGFTKKFFVGPMAKSGPGAPMTPTTSTTSASGSRTRPAAARAAAGAPKTIEAPKSSHLVRRAEYLLKILQTHVASAKAKKARVALSSRQTTLTGESTARRPSTTTTKRSRMTPGSAATGVGLSDSPPSRASKKSKLSASASRSNATPSRTTNSRANRGRRGRSNADESDGSDFEGAYPPNDEHTGSGDSTMSSNDRYYTKDRRGVSDGEDSHDHANGRRGSAAGDDGSDDDFGNHSRSNHRSKSKRSSEQSTGSSGSHRRTSRTSARGERGAVGGMASPSSNHRGRPSDGSDGDFDLSSPVKRSRRAYDERSSGGPSALARNGSSSRRSNTSSGSNRRSGHERSTSRGRGNANGSVGEPDYSHYDSMDDNDCKERMRAVRHELKKIRKDDPALSTGDKARHIRECIKSIGDHIEKCVQETRPATVSVTIDQANGCSNHEGNAPGEKLHRHLWAFTTYFWPRPVSPEKLQTIYKKMAE